MIRLRSSKKLAKTAKNDYLIIFISLTHEYEIEKEFKVVFLQGHPKKISVRTLIKDHRTAVTIIGTRYYNGFGDPPSLDGYCYNL